MMRRKFHPPPEGPRHPQRPQQQHPHPQHPMPGPIRPSHPAHPPQPVRPSPPAQPVRPVHPVHPPQPVRPVHPAPPAQPVRPVHPVPSPPPTRPMPPPPPPPPPAKMPVRLMDYGPQPYVVDIEQATMQNNTFRTVLWTGPYLQVTVMSIPPGEDIGLERHAETDQFLRIESGQGLVQMGMSRNHLTLRQPVFADSAVFVPAGTWHNITNIGDVPLKLYSIYAPPEHPHGTVHPTKAIAEQQEGNH